MGATGGRMGGPRWDGSGRVWRRQGKRGNECACWWWRRWGCGENIVYAHLCTRVCVDAVCPCACACLRLSEVCVCLRVILAFPLSLPSFPCLLLDFFSASLLNCLYCLLSFQSLLPLFFPHSLLLFHLSSLTHVSSSGVDCWRKQSSGTNVCTGSTIAIIARSNSPRTNGRWRKGWRRGPRRERVLIRKHYAAGRTRRIWAAAGTGAFVAVLLFSLCHSFLLFPRFKYPPQDVNILFLTFGGSLSCKAASLPDSRMTHAVFSRISFLSSYLWYPLCVPY